MIAVAHHFSDSGQRGIEHFAAQIHCDLAREYDFAAPLAADNVGRRNIEVICNGVDDKFRRDHLLLVRGDDVAQHLLCKINVDFTFFKVCVCMILLRAPSNSRMFDLILEAMYSITSSLTE